MFFKNDKLTIHFQGWENPLRYRAWVDVGGRGFYHTGNPTTIRESLLRLIEDNKNIDYYPFLKSGFNLGNEEEEHF